MIGRKKERKPGFFILKTAKNAFSFNILNHKLLKWGFVKVLTQVCPVNGQWMCFLWLKKMFFVTQWITCFLFSLVTGLVKLLFNTYFHLSDSKAFMGKKQDDHRVAKQISIGTFMIVNTRREAASWSFKKHVPLQYCVAKSMIKTNTNSVYTYMQIKKRQCLKR